MAIHIHQSAPAASPAKPEPNKLQMRVKIYTPFKVYFEGDADSVTAVNDTGTFDILPKHHNFMTLLNQGYIIVRTEGQEQKIAILRGIMHVKADKVIVFLDV